ncbi:MAG: hypoxanthine phosphoribosyltransferase [Deltaproteobacteria bacterium]|nr:hypoxanthine phosphoribosyltransferase [Deltaproteobacteria bacterium]
MKNDHATKPAVFIGEGAIRTRVSQLARKISTDYADADELLLVGVLRGCYIFLSDLSRLLTIKRRIDFIAVTTYEQTITMPGAVRLLMDVRTDIAGKHVLIVDDILDTGKTLQYLLQTFQARNPASLKTCVLLRKSERLIEDVQIDYLGFDIPDVWVVGYGLDYADQNRALPYIGMVKTEED